MLLPGDESTDPREIMRREYEASRGGKLPAATGEDPHAVMRDEVAKDVATRALREPLGALLDKRNTGILAQARAAERLRTSRDIAKDFPAETLEVAKERFKLAADLGAREPQAVAQQRLDLAGKVGLHPDTLRDPVMRQQMEATAKWLNIPVDELIGTKVGTWMASDPTHMSLVDGKPGPLMAVGTSLADAEDARARAMREKKGQTGVLGILEGLASGVGASIGHLITVVPDVAEAAADYLVPPSEVSLASRRAGPVGAPLEYIRKLTRGSEATRLETPNLLAPNAKGEPEFNWQAINPLRVGGLMNIANLVAGEAVPMGVQMVLAAETSGATAPAAAATSPTLSRALRFAKAYATSYKSPSAWLNTGRVIQGQFDEGVKDLMAKKGLTEAEARSKVAGGALLAGFASSLFGSPMEAHLVEGWANDLGRSPMGAAFLQRAYTRLKGFAISGAKEGAQEVLEGIGEDLSAMLTYDSDKTVQEMAANAVMNAVGGFALGGPVGAVVSGGNQIHAAKNAQFIAALANPELRASLGDVKLREFVQSVTAGGNLEALAVDSKALTTLYQSQGMTDEQVAHHITTELGVDPHTYTTTVQTGGDFVINTGVYAEKLAREEHFPEVFAATRAFENGPTLGELQQQFATEQFREETDKALQALTTEGPEADQREAVKRELATMLTAASRVMTPRQTEQIADHVSRVLTVQAKRAGTTVEQLFTKDRLTIQKAMHGTVIAETDARITQTPGVQQLLVAAEAVRSGAAPEMAQQFKDAGIDPSTMTDGQLLQEVDDLYGTAPEQAKGLVDGSVTLYHALTARVPSAVSSVVDPVGDVKVNGLDALREDPVHMAKVVATVASHAGVVVDPKASVEEQAQQVVAHLKSNLLFLYNAMPNDIKERAKLWYEGANKIAKDIVDREGNFTLSQISGLMAVLSPQRDWFQNVSLAERVLDVYVNHQNFRWDAKMSKALVELKKAEAATALDRLKKAYKKAHGESFFDAVKRAKADGTTPPTLPPIKLGDEGMASWESTIVGKTFGELEGKAQAAWLRAYDLAHNPRTFRTVTPEGDFLGNVLNADKVKKVTDRKTKEKVTVTTPGGERSIGWGGLGDIAKAITILRNADPTTLSDALGGAHKVRNFYNNIFNPSDPLFATIDTHAVAAALLLPLGGTSKEVTASLSGAKSSATGNAGTYSLYFEAYLQAAEAAKVLPREMQSITWEALRGLFSPEEKRDAAVDKTVRGIWKAYTDGDITRAEAQDQILKSQGGKLKEPSWHVTKRLHQGDPNVLTFAHNPTREQQRALGGSLLRATSLGAGISESSFGGAPWSYERGAGRDDGGVRGLSVPTLQSWVLHPDKVADLKAMGHESPVVHELDYNHPGAAPAFRAAILKLREGNRFAPAVHVYDESDYAAMRMFMSEDGKAGFALKPDGDIISVFVQKDGPKGAVHTMLEIAKQAGGTKLDCFDTVLPKIYSRHGFIATSRLAWNDDYAPEGWDKEVFKEFSGGEPAVVMMAFHPDAKLYVAGDGELVADYDEAVRLQTEVVQKVAGNGPPTEVPPGTVTYQQPAYHGSPYKFDRFTMEHMGKGEGGQAFGWGLYFADRKATAEWYRQTTTPEGYTVNGEKLRPDSPEFYAASFLMGAQGDKAMALDDLKHFGGVAPATRRAAATKLLAMDYAHLKPDQGQMYKVDIPDSGYLDWFAKMKDQSAEVADALDQLGVGHSAPNESGSSVYSRLVAQYGSPEAASKALRSAGLNGIKYLDAAARLGGEDASNYVVFDDAAIKILDTFYAGSDAQPLGEISFPSANGQPRTLAISLFENENKATIFHELGHFYLELLGDMAEMPGADQSVKDDYATILKWFGVSSRAEITTAHHEMFADGHLVYLSEAKAPVPELQSAFSKFSRWLSKLGQSLLGVPVEMNDEVRGVFDRLYAAEQEIEDARKDVTFQLFSTAEQARMSADEFKAYSAAVEKELTVSKEKMVQKLMRQLDRQQKREYREQLQNITDEIALTVNAQPEYQASMSLAHEVMYDGETPVPKLNKQWLVEHYGADILNRLPKEGLSRVYAEGASGTPDQVATLLGIFDGSGDAMVKAMLEAPSRSKLIAARAQEQMNLAHPEAFTDEAGLRAMAMELLQGEGRETVLGMELRALARARAQAAGAVAVAKRKASGEAKAAAQSREALNQELQRISADNSKAAEQARKELRKELDRIAKQEAQEKLQVMREAMVFEKMEAFRAAAREHVNSTPVWKLNPGKFLQDQRKASKEAYNAAIKDNFQAAQEAKEREILSHFLYVESNKAVEASENFREFIKRSDSSTRRESMAKAGHGILAQFDALRDRFSIERTPNKILKSTDLGTWLRTMSDEHGQDVAIAEWLLDTARPVVNYRDLTVKEQAELRDALTSIQHAAKEQLSFIKDGKRIYYETVQQEMTEAAEKNLPFKPVITSTNPKAKTASHIAKATLAGFDATMLKIQQIVNWIDGDDVNGPAHRYIWRPMVESQAREHALSTAIHRPIIAAWEALPLEYRRSLALEDKFDVGLLDEAGEKRLFTRSEVLTMLMYNGQETRRAKLLGGMASTGLTEQKMLQLFTYLKPEDITLANTMWRAFADMAQHTLDLEERRQGVRPEWEEARPFDVHGPDGEVIGKATGGYFPLVAERSGGEQIAQKQEGGTVQQVMASNGYSRATTSQGHTKELTGKVYPLLLDFEQIITAELANQIKDVAYRENILVVDKILRSKQFTDLMVRRLGPEQVEQLGQWLINVVSDHNVGSSKGFRAWNKAVTYINGATTSAVIAYKWGSMVVQPADLTRVLGSSSYGVRPGHLLSAYGELLPGNPKRQTTIDMIKQLSPQMAMREENIDRDLRARIKELSGKDGYYAAFQRGGYAGLTAVDALISWPTWLGSYRQSLAVHGDETRAALEADRTVGLLLQGGAPKDLPTLTGSKDPWVKLITFFMGDATNGYNMLRNAGHNINGMKGIPAFTGATLAIMLGAIIGDLLKGQWPDDDDDAEAWILRKAMLAPAGTVPILRDAANVADNAIAGKPFTDWRFSPAVGTLTKISSALTVHPIKFAKGEESGADFLINEMEGVGYALGVPGTAQATLSAKYFKRVMEGEERPANPAQFGWDFLRGKKKEKR